MLETKFQKEKELWWVFLRDIVKEKHSKGEPLETITGVRNKILEVGEDYFVVKSEQGKKNRKITKERVKRVLQMALNKGYYSVYPKAEDMSAELLNLNDGSNLKGGAHSSIIRGLLINLPFIKEGGRATKIVFSLADYDKAKWGIEF